MPNESMDAFDRAFATPATGDPLVAPEQEKELNVDPDSAFDRAWEASTVSTDNADVENEDVSFFQRVFAEPYERAIQKQSQVFSRMASTYGGNGNQQLGQALSDPAVLQEQYRQNTNIPSVLLQTATTPLSMIFDGASEMVLYGAEKGVGWLPEEFREDSLKAFQDLMKTQGGQMALNAAGQGVKAWESFKESNPNEAANLTAILDVGFAKFSSKAVPDYTPMKMERVGLRNEVKPLAGDDADIYKILFEQDKKTPEQVELTTDPQGPLGVQEQLATADQLELVDVAKKAGLSGNQTLQKNYNKLQTYYQGLEDNLMKLLARNEKKINWPQIDTNLRANHKAQFDKMVESNPKLMSSKAAEAETAKLFKEFLSILDEQGGTLQGLRVARSMFDDRLKRMGYNVDGTKLNTGNLASMAVRNAVNETIYGVVPEAQGLFTQMSKIIPTIGSLGTKAAKEANSTVGRFMQELGIEKFLGGSALAVASNAAYVLGGTAVLSPYFIIKNQLKRPLPAKGRAKLAYIKRDMMSEIAKKIKDTTDPIKKQSLITDSRAVYTYLNAAFKEIDEEMKAEEKEASNG